MDDPVYTRKFISDIILERKSDIIGLAVVKGNRLKLGKGKSRIAYIFSLLLIMGFKDFFLNSFDTILFRFKFFLNKISILKEDPSIASFAHSKGIKTYKISNPNDINFLHILQKSKPDIIINQSQSILKKKLLSIPKIGVLNRHNALLPKNRGRLTPFWVIFYNQKYTGVSIHFVEEGIDSGDILVQRKFKVNMHDNFNTIAKKNYEIAALAMLDALKLIETKKYKTIDNDDKFATYNTTPTLKEALVYRIKILKRNIWKR